MSFIVITMKQLSVDGISLGAIAKQYGSPVYVYSAAGIIEAFTSFQNAVAPVNGKVYFAMKAILPSAFWP